MTAPLRRGWRIEHPESQMGPFSLDCWYRIKDPDPYCMPSPHWETPYRGTLPDLWSDMGYRCAFDSLASLLYWANETARHRAHDAGCVLRVIGVPWDQHVLLPAQIVYPRKAAVVIREMSVLERIRLRQMAAARTSSTSKRSTCLASPASRGATSESRRAVISVPASCSLTSIGATG